MGIPGHIRGGSLPTKNYTTNMSAEYEKFRGDLLRSYFKLSRAFPCWACGMKHIHKMEILEGPYKGFVGEEPEYEATAEMGPAPSMVSATALRPAISPVSWLK